jgi:hypothetical protein
LTSWIRILVLNPDPDPLTGSSVFNPDPDLKLWFHRNDLLISGEARDALINLIMKNCPYNQLDWAEKLLKTDAYYRLMEVASELNLEEFR